MIPDVRNRIVEMLEGTDFSGDDLEIIRTVLQNDESLRDEIRLSNEIDEAIFERDIILLRNQLKNMSDKTANTSNNEYQADTEAYFGLSEEVFKSVNLNIDSQEPLPGNYLQKLHIKNHSFTSKEIVHDLFTEKEEILEVDNHLMSPEDELLFDDIRDAMLEKEIIDLRANLQSVAQGLSIHERTFEEIDEFVNGELDDEIENLIREEALINSALSNEIDLHSEINRAIEELDVMKLRDGLKEMMKSEYSHSRTIEEIEGYLNDELDDYSLAHFEEEFLCNPGLVSDLAFHKEVDLAVAEADVMSLRANLRIIAGDEKKRNIDTLGVTSPKRKNLFWYAAASTIVLMLVFSSLLKQKTYTNQQLYTTYYQPYKNGSNVSRSALASVNGMNSMLREIDKGDYSAALKSLGSIPEKEKDSFSTNFYSGLAYQGLGEFNDAIKSFTKVVQHGDNLLVEQSEWYIGLCYLRIEEREKAVKQFKYIVSRNGFYREKSSKLLKQIE